MNYPASSFLILGISCIVLCLAVNLASAQYNTYDSDSNSDSDGGPILTNTELGKLMRNSGRGGKSGAQLRHLHNQQQLAATRNLYNKQQPLQYAPTQHNRRQYGGGDSLAGYNPLSESSSHGRGHSSANDDDDGEGSANFGQNYGANFDSDSNDGESSAQAEGGAPMRLNQAASGYPGQGDYSEQAAAGYGSAGYGYGPMSSADSGDFPSEDSIGNEGRRAKSASSLMGAHNYGLSQGDEDAGAPQYGPNSAILRQTAILADDEGRSGYAPEASSSSSDNDNDDD